MPGSAVNPTLDIIDTILAEASFKTFLGALQTAGMVDALKSSGPFTIFAPTDQAFDALPPGCVQGLEKPEHLAMLIALLEGHIVKGKHGSSDLRQRMTITAANGKVYNLVASGEHITVGNAHVLGHPIPCTNGVIHVIDSVLS